MAILGMPIGLILGQKKRPWIVYFFIKMLIIVFVWIITTYIYYLTLTVCQDFCYKGKISEWFMWLPDVIIIVPGIVMICFINKGKTGTYSMVPAE